MDRTSYAVSSLAEVLARLAGELAMAGDQLSHVEAAATRVVLEEQTPTPDDLRAFQQTDQVLQTLAALVEFMRDIAPEVGDLEVNIQPAANKMLLRDVAGRLCGGYSPAPERSSGDIDLF